MRAPPIGRFAASRRLSDTAGWPPGLTVRRVLPPRVKTARSFPLPLALVPFSGPPTSTPTGGEVVWFFAESVTRTASVCRPEDSRALGATLPLARLPHGFGREKSHGNVRLPTTWVLAGTVRSISPAPRVATLSPAGDAPPPP